MAVLVITQARSSGATTTALALGRCWPRPVLVVEADCEPSQAAYDGGEVVARIHAGSQSLGGRLFGGIARVVRHRILFRWL